MGNFNTTSDITSKRRYGHISESQKHRQCRDWQIFNRKREIWVETKGRIERDTVEWILLSRCKTWNDLPQGDVNRTE